MRIVLVAPEIPDYSIEVAQIVAESNDVLLYINKKHFAIERPSSRPGLEFVWIDWPRQRELQNVFFIMSLSRRIREWRPDIVHVMNESNIWLNLLVLLLKDIPIITTVHDVRIHPGDHSSQRVPRIFSKMLAKLSWAIVVHGDGLRNQAIREFGVPSDSVYIAPHPPLRYYFDVAIQNNFSKPDDNIFRVLFYGRIYKYKGLRYLLDAAPLVRAKVPNLCVVVAGQGEDFGQYRRQIRDPSYFEVHNHLISTLDTARLFAEADVLALPYTEASQSGVLMMSVPFGLPVVATDVGEISGQVNSLKNGLVVPPSDEIALAAAIIRLATDAGLRKQCSDNAIEAMGDRYSNQTLSSQMSAIYRKVLARGN